MNSWQIITDKSLLGKKKLYTNLDMGDITDADYKYGKRVLQDFKIKTLDEYHDL